VKVRGLCDEGYKLAHYIKWQGENVMLISGKGRLTFRKTLFPLGGESKIDVETYHTKAEVVTSRFGRSCFRQMHEEAA